MGNEHDPSPDQNHLRKADNSYGTSEPAEAGPLLDKRINFPGDESLFAALVTDCSTEHYSCTVTIPLRTAHYGIPCLWVSSSINRHGGACDFNPPEIGSVVLVYVSKGSNFGTVIGQLPGLLNTDPRYPGGGFVDPIQAVTAFNEDTGQVMRALGTGGSGLNGYQGQPNDAFPGERGIINEFGIGLGVMRLMSFLKGSEMAKIELYALDDLVKIAAKNLDVFLGSGDFEVRDDKGNLFTSYGLSHSHKESLGMLGEDAGDNPLWRYFSIGGYHGDIKRDYVTLPTGIDAMIGLSEEYSDSSGMKVSRAISGGGFVKTRGISVPKKIRRSEDPTGCQDVNPPEIDPDGFNDFSWDFNSPDHTAQMRDALAYLLGRQSKAKFRGYEKDNPDWDVGSDSDAVADKGNSGGNAGIGGHVRDMIEAIDVTELDAGDGSKPRAVRINDAWVFILPDGSVTIRDGHGSAITMVRGKIVESASKDIDFIAGRNINFKAGNDITMAARGSMDLTAAKGQVRLFGGKSMFFHSEDGGMLFTTNSKGYASDPQAKGSDLETGGIIFRPSDAADFVVQSRSTFIQNREHFFVGGWVDPNNSNIITPPDIRFEGRRVYHKINESALWQFGGGQAYARMGSGIYTFETSGSISLEGNVDAIMGTVRVNKTHDEHEREDFCISPGSGYTTLVDRYLPLFENVPITGQDSKARRNAARTKCNADPDNGGVSSGIQYDWLKLRGNFDRQDVYKLEFSLRTEEQYGTTDVEFAWVEQPWMREWGDTAAWGIDAKTVGHTTRWKSYVYPGQSYWETPSGYMQYEEGNVAANGDPKHRDVLSWSGGEFTMTGFTELGRHPDPEP